MDLEQIDAQLTISRTDLEVVRGILIENFSNRNLIENPGLINGRLGLCINMHFFGRYLNDLSLLDNAFIVLKEICLELNYRTPPYFYDGFSGFGWGVLLLVQNKFYERDELEVFNEFDALLGATYKYSTPLSFDLDKGHFGRALYVSKRLIVDNGREDPYHFDMLQLGIRAIESIYVTIFAKREALVEEQVSPTAYSNLLICLEVLYELHKADVFNSKVEKGVNLLINQLLVSVPKLNFNKLAVASACISLRQILPNNEELQKLYSICIAGINEEELYKELGYENETVALYFDKLIASKKYLDNLNTNGIDVSGIQIKVNQILSFYINSIKSENSSFQPKIIAQNFSLLDGYLGFYSLLH